MKRGRFSEEQIIRKLAERFGLPMQASSSGRRVDRVITSTPARDRTLARKLVLRDYLAPELLDKLAPVGPG